MDDEGGCRGQSGCFQKNMVIFAKYVLPVHGADEITFRRRPVEDETGLAEPFPDALGQPGHEIAILFRQALHDHTGRQPLLNSGEGRFVAAVESHGRRRSGNGGG